MPTSPIQVAITANVLVLQQGSALLAAVGAERYARQVPLGYNASIGGHVRHVIEHYQAFVRGLEEGDIDYEKRVRDPLVENDPVYAGDLLEALAQRLEELRRTLTNSALYYCVETTEGIASPTSVLRELEFLLSHTIHHYALVAVMARLQGHEPEPTFGIAPSTLKYQHAQAGASQFFASPLRPCAPKGHDSRARGNAPGTRREKIASPEGAGPFSRPFRAHRSQTRFPGALPRAVKSRPVGAERRLRAGK